MTKTAGDQKPAPAPNGAHGEIIGVKEAAKILHVSASWIYGQKKMGLLPFRTLQPSPGKFFFDSADIDDYVASCWRPAGMKKNK
jgi:predicted DNA-binding transcriptional regulator AlpA